jgi:hypothetical protein
MLVFFYYFLYLYVERYSLFLISRFIMTDGYLSDISDTLRPRYRSDRSIDLRDPQNGH